MKIGITEQGDPTLDLSWIDKIDTMDGVIVVSKGFNSTFDRALLDHRDKIIYHCVITGFGGTPIEPHVHKSMQVIGNLFKLIRDGFPINQIVVRLDPILPEVMFEKYLGLTYERWFDHIYRNVVRYCSIKRVRYSYVDVYPHVRARFAAANIEGLPEEFTLSGDDRRKIQTCFQKFIGVKLESCGEKNTPPEHNWGCVSSRDIELLGLDWRDIAPGTSCQRGTCCCIPNKTELLSSKHPCYHGCLYCYWKDVADGKTIGASEAES